VIVEQGIVMPDAAYRLIRVGSGLARHGRRMAIVDESDYRELAWRNWSLKRGEGGNFYATTSCRGESVEMHRMILGVTDPLVIVDHRDGFGLNNRRYNLDATDSKGNMATKKSWRIERNKRTGLWDVIVRSADGAETVLGPFESYSAAHEERYGKRAYWGMWE
jgi:hypothetical protein